MSFNADAVILMLAILLAAIVLAVLAYITANKIKARRQQRDIAAIRAIIIDYFRRTGVEVSADCFRSAAGFTAVVESEPMKRFRLSHIIEMTVREHVRKACDLELDKIYWRFPIKDAVQAVAVADANGSSNDNAGGNNTEAGGEKKSDELSDEYINEGLEHYRHIPKPEVTEIPWETFEQVATIGKEKKGEE
ncbi:MULTISPECIES: hypothetical protein [Oxalobacteraceae]|jgi:type II secretory pathway pseudopilin PulG|uniref:hypothetical protein n=1 Tax=Oxalobacteraceae TaxID=75682 RepID=UPI0010A528E9|nr:MULTISPECIES: hypothetical protein [Oxalobacteraceae]